MLWRLSQVPTASGGRVSRRVWGVCGREGRCVLLADAEVGEDSSEEIVGDDLACDVAELLAGFTQFHGDEFGDVEGFTGAAGDVECAVDGGGGAVECGPVACVQGDQVGSGVDAVGVEDSGDGGADLVAAGAGSGADGQNFGRPGRGEGREAVAEAFGGDLIDLIDQHDEGATWQVGEQFEFRLHGGFGSVDDEEDEFCAMDGAVDGFVGEAVDEGFVESEPGSVDEDGFAVGQFEGCGEHIAGRAGHR